MNRRLLTILLPAAAATLVAGCSVFDTDTVARVGDDELSQEQLEELVELLPAAGTPQGSAPIPGDISNVNDVRQSISIWIQSQVQDDHLEERGLEIPAQSIDENTAGLSGPTGLAGFIDASDETRDLLVRFLSGFDVISQPAAEASPGLLDFYGTGVDASGLICTSHILVSDEETATDLSTLLDDGADFAELALSNSIDEGSAISGGDLGCQRVDVFSTQFIPEFVDAALAAEVDQPTAPVASQFGFHIIVVRGADTAGQSLATLESDPLIAIQRADVTIDPRYGTFDAATVQVVPLGS